MNSMYHPKLKELKKDDVKRFSLEGKERYAKVVSIYDGRTFDLAFDLDDNKIENAVKFKCIMSGYNAPKLDETNGAIARDYLAHLCMGGDTVEPADFCDQNGTLSKADLQEQTDRNKRLVYAKFKENDQYGQPIVTVHQTSLKGHPPRVKKSINDMMTNFVEELELLDQYSSESSTDSDRS